MPHTMAKSKRRPRANLVHKGTFEFSGQFWRGTGMNMADVPAVLVR